jgi:hypothetical protein
MAGTQADNQGSTTMKESQFLGTLLPSHPDFLPIEKAIREKYGLPEFSPDDDPIAEVFLGDEIIPLEEFRKDIENFSFR